MFDYEKNKLHLDSAVIHSFLTELDPKLQEKIKKVRFNSPWYGLNNRFYDSKYCVPGVYIVRSKIDQSIIRIGYSDDKVATAMYWYLCRLPGREVNFECSIIKTLNGDSKKISGLLNRVHRFEETYGEYLKRQKEIEDNVSLIQINNLDRVFPFTGNLRNKGREYTLKVERVAGVYFIWKKDKLDYIGMGFPLIKRLYHHFIEIKKPDREKPHCVFYSREEVERGDIKVAIISIYRKMINAKQFFWEEDVFRAESDTEFRDRILDIETRLINDHNPEQNSLGVVDPFEEVVESENAIVSNQDSIDEEDIPF